jgi:hypothetical protein
MRAMLLAVSLSWSFLLNVPEPPGGRAAVQLLTEGDKLADKEQYTDALLRYKQAYEKILPDLRGLKFKNPVAPQFMDRAALRGNMEKMFRAEMTDDDLALADASLKVFGLVPADFKTEETVLRLYSEEVAGFYDPKRKEIFLIKEAPPKAKPGLLERLLGGGSAFDKDEQKAALSHEMAHALADQHFGLEKMQKAAEDDDDRSLALQALIEGEATLVMMQEATRGNGDGREFLHTSPATMDATLNFMQFIMPFATGKTFRTAPPIFRETMIFGYFKGMVFILHLTNDGEWSKVNHAFRDPPLSTEQILHPEKFLKRRDDPVDIVLPKLDELIPAGWKRLGENVWGELQISIMLRRHGGERAAAGWDGDRFVILQGPAGDLAYVWATTWDSPQDAREFAAAFAAYTRSRAGEAGDGAKPAAKDPPKIADDTTLTGGDSRECRIVRRDRDVIIVEGLPRAVAQQWIEAAFKAEKRAKRS